MLFLFGLVIEELVIAIDHLTPGDASIAKCEYSFGFSWKVSRIKKRIKRERNTYEMVCDAIS